MDSRALASLIIRLSGLLIVVYAATNTAKSLVPLFITASPQGVSYSDVALSALFSLGFPVAIGLLLIYFPVTITTRVLRVEGADIDSNSAVILQQVAFSSVGLWLVVFAVVDAIYFYGKTRLYLRYIEDSPTPVRMPPMLPDDFGGFLSCGVQFVIGLFLLVGSKALANLWIRLRG